MWQKIEEIKNKLVCLVPKEGRSGITCHEKTLCDCEVLETIALLETQLEKARSTMISIQEYWNGHEASAVDAAEFSRDEAASLLKEWEEA